MKDNPFHLKVMAPETFQFVAPLFTCTYWSSGAHIVAANGYCRCGKRFGLFEIVPNK